MASVQQTDAATLGNDLSSAAHSALLVDYWSRHSPFRSLQTFETDDAWLFFGRAKETDDLLTGLGRAPVMVMVGNSGSGKSSLLRAGLIPALRAGRFQHAGLPVDQWRIAVVRPSGAPFDCLAEALPYQLTPELSSQERAEFIAYCRSHLPFRSEALGDAIKALVTPLAGQTGSPHILLVVDQFEEIFTLTTHPQTRERYTDALLAICRPGSPISVHLVLALRADFYAHCLEHAGLSRWLEINQYNVPRMTQEQLRETIEKRLTLAAVRAEPGLIDSLLEDVGAEPGNLALLEHALGQLWEKCGRYACTLTNRAYAEVGRLRGALGRHADEVYAGIGDDKHKQLLQKIFLELVTLGEGGNVQDTRRRAAKVDLLSLGVAEEVEALLARLASSRLIAVGREGQENFVEVSHEALIREWPALREWLAQNREEIRLERRLLQAAGEWQALDRDPGALLQGARLTQAEEWLSRRPNTLGALAEYVKASLAARAHAEQLERETQMRELSQQRSAAVRLRFFSCALAVLLLVAVTAGAYAYRQQVLGKSRYLAAQARELLARDHGQALQLALRSWNTAKSDESHVALASVFPEQVAIFRHEAPVESAIFSADGQRILSASVDSTARLWNGVDGTPLAILQGHTREVSHADFSPDAKRIATASYDHTARIWDGLDGHLLAVLKGHADKLDWVAFSPDGKLLVTASRDRTARVWNSAKGQLLTVLQGHTAEVTRAEFSHDGKRVVSAGNDHTARVWDSTTGRLLATLSGHTAELRYAAFFPDDGRIVTTSEDGTARIWNSRDGRLIVTLHHRGPVENAKFSPDGRFIVTTSHDYSTRVWDERDGRLLLTLPQDGPVQYAEFSPDGRYVVTASNDHTARVWNSTNGRLLAVTLGHSDAVYYAAFSPSGDRIVTASGDHTVRIWNLVTGLTLATMQGHNSFVLDAGFSPDARYIVTASKDHTARIWSAADGQLLAMLRGHTDGVWKAEFSPDGQRIVTASSDGTARIWGTDGHPLATLQGHADKVWHAQFSPDGQRIVTASSDGTARVWNAGDGRLLVTLRGHSEDVWRAAFSPDGQRVVTASSDNTARIWSAADGHLLAILRGHTESVDMAVFSPDGQRVVTASDDHTARIWNAADGSLLAILQGHTHAVRAARFSPDGQSIVTASLDFTARIWNSADGRLRATLQGHSAELRTAGFSPDGRHVLTASDDHTARIWNSANGHLETILQGHTAEISAAAFSSDGQRIVTASQDQTARVWCATKLEDIEALLAN